MTNPYIAGAASSSLARSPVKPDPPEYESRLFHFSARSRLCDISSRGGAFSINSRPAPTRVRPILPPAALPYPASTSRSHVLLQSQYPHATTTRNITSTSESPRLYSASPSAIVANYGDAAVQEESPVAAPRRQLSSPPKKSQTIIAIIRMSITMVGMPRSAAYSR